MVTNWAGNVVFGAGETGEPASVDELAELVAGTARVRVAGTRHSFNQIADTAGTLVSLSRMPVVFEVAPDRATVWVGAGLTLAQLAVMLHEVGLALHTLPSLPHITVAGSCLTATHGSGDQLGSLAAAVRRIELITSSGQRRVLSSGDLDFDGAVVSLGALGVVSALELAVRPSFAVRQRVFDGVGWESLVEHVDTILSCAYSVSVFTGLSGPSRVWVKSQADDPEVDLSGTGAAPARGPQHPIRGADPTNCTDQLGEPGPWHERLPHFRPEFAPSTGAELQSEFLLPREYAADALRAVKALEEVMVPVALTIEVRSIAAEPLWLSPSYRRASVGLHFSWRPDEAAVWPVVRAVERALAPLSPRPHWGKLFSTASTELASRYERWPDFCQLRTRFDPERKFANPTLDAWFGG